MKHKNERYGSDNPLDWKEEYEMEMENKIQNPGHVDESLWDKAKKASMKSYGELRYPFIMYLYKKMGGE